MSEWISTTVGALGKVITGKTPSKDNPEDWGNEYLFVTPSDYGSYNKYARYSLRGISDTGYQRHKVRVIPKDSCLVTCIGSDMGKVVKNAKDAFCNQQINALIPNESIVHSDYAYYFFKDSAQLLKTLGSDGTAVPILNKSDFERIELALPSLPEQKAIASVLSSLDDKIDLLHRQNKTLEAMAETLFRQRFIEEAKEDWEEKTIGDIFTIKGGGTPSTKEPSYWDGGIAWTSPRDLSTAKSLFMFSTERTITELGLSKVSSGLLPVETLLMSSRAPIGYLALTEIEVAVNQGYIALLDHELYNNRYMYLWCKANMELIKNSGNGSVFQEISKASFRDLPFVCPPVELVEKFNILAKQWFAKIRVNAKQIQTLEQLRDTLLPKLMSGEVRVQYQTEEVA